MNSTSENQFKPSPHTKRDIGFMRKHNTPYIAKKERDSLCTHETGSLVLVPNKKALVTLIRQYGFHDVLEISICHSFTSIVLGAFIYVLHIPNVFYICHNSVGFSLCPKSARGRIQMTFPICFFKGFSYFAQFTFFYRKKRLRHIRVKRIF